MIVNTGPSFIKEIVETQSQLFGELNNKTTYNLTRVLPVYSLHFMKHESNMKGVEGGGWNSFKIWRATESTVFQYHKMVVYTLMLRKS